MIDKETAKQLVLNKINDPAFVVDAQSEMVVIDDYTIEKDFGWIFFWDSRVHQQTGEFQYALTGNAPIIVNRYDGSLHWTGTAYPVEHFIRENEDHLEREQLKWALLIKDVATLTILKKLKEALGLSLRELATMKESLPGVIEKGANPFLLPKYEALILHGVEAEIRESSRCK
jgi:hypothetical protein